MTVSSAVNKVAYTANGTSKNFSVPFYFIYKSDLKVYRSYNGIGELLTPETDYTIIGTPERTDGSVYKNGGTVVMKSMPAAGTRFVILREVAMTQEADYQEGSTFPAALHELSLDKLTMQTQQLAEQVGRAVTVDLFSDANPSEIIDKIEALYDVKDDVFTAAQIAREIKDCSDNMASVVDAPDQALSAALSAGNSAANARIYAIDAAKRNVGDLFFTSRRGNLPGAVYNCADFAGDGCVPALLEAGEISYISMREYERVLSGDPINGTFVASSLNEGRYSVTSNEGYFAVDRQIPLGTADTWEFQTRWFNAGAGGSERFVLFGANESSDCKNPMFSVAVNGSVQAHIGSTGNTWDIVSGPSLGLTISVGETYDLRFGFDGTQYYFSYKLPVADAWTTSWTVETSVKCYSTGNIILGNMRLAASFGNLYYNSGIIFTEKTLFKINGEVCWRAGTGLKALNSCSFFGWDGHGAETFRVPKAEKAKRVLVYSKIPSVDSSYGELLYSDGYYVCWDNWNNVGSAAPAGSAQQVTVYLQRHFLDNNYDLQLSSGVGESGWQFANGASVGFGYQGPDGKNLSKGTNWFKFSMSTGNGTVYFGYRVAGYTQPPQEDEYQFQNIEVHRAMVQIAHGASDEALEICSGVLADIAKFKYVRQLPATSGLCPLNDNEVYSGSVGGAISFTLPEITDGAVHHQIKAMIHLPVVTIDWGTSFYMTGYAPSVLKEGYYTVYWDYVPSLGWAVAATLVE